MHATELPENPSKIDNDLLDLIRQPDFPCVGAKAAVARGNVTIIQARDLRSAWNDVEIHRLLLEWSWADDTSSDDLRSFAVVFAEPLELDEEKFERLMWERIQSLSDKDGWLGQRYDRTVSADPSDPHFALSFGGSAYFVVGLHPGSSRPARRSPLPTLVFNPHDQFERLRAEGRFDRMQQRILARDVKLAGSVNPMLSAHGEESAARQYSGRAVDSDWVCPFRDERS